MYLGIDIGGTKTLVATLSDDGQILASQRFPTNQSYDQFLNDLKDNLGQLTLEPDFHCVTGVPGHINRETGLVYALGNLPWRNKPIRDDITRITKQPVIIENDSRLAGLSEARLVKNQHQTVLFATISTGIGGALIRDGRIVPALRDMEMGKMPLSYEGRYVHWEDFAGGRGVVERLHKMASEISDPAEWQAVAEPVAYGLAAVCSILQPDVIILGGSVGKHTAKFAPYISDFLDEHLHIIVSRPQAILAAQRPDEAVIYGCYDLANQMASHANADN